MQIRWQRLRSACAEPQTCTVATTWDSRTRGVATTINSGLTSGKNLLIHASCTQPTISSLLCLPVGPHGAVCASEA